MRLPITLITCTFVLVFCPHLLAQSGNSVIRLDSINSFTYRSHLKAIHSSLHHWNPSKNQGQVWEPHFVQSTELCATGGSGVNLIAAAVNAVGFLSGGFRTEIESKAESSLSTSSLELQNDYVLIRKALAFSYSQGSSISDSLRRHGIPDLLGTPDDWPRFNKPNRKVDHAFFSWTVLEEPDGKKHLLDFDLVMENCDRGLKKSITDLPMDGLHATDFHSSAEMYSLSICPLESNPHAIQVLDAFLNAGYQLELYEASTQTVNSYEKHYFARACDIRPEEIRNSTDYERFKEVFLEEMQKLDSNQ